MLCYILEIFKTCEIYMLPYPCGNFLKTESSQHTLLRSGLKFFFDKLTNETKLMNRQSHILRQHAASWFIFFCLFWYLDTKYQVQKFLYSQYFILILWLITCYMEDFMAEYRGKEYEYLLTQVVDALIFVVFI